MEIKRKQLERAVLLRLANHQALKQLLLTKKARLRNPQVQLHLKIPRRLLTSLQQVQRHHKRHLHQSKDKVKKWLINRQLVIKRLLRFLQPNRLLKPNLTNQAMILQLTANFKISKQSKINATRVF